MSHVMSRVARWWFTLTGSVFVLAYGGAGDQATTWFGVLMIPLLILVALSMRSHLHRPDLRWFIIFVPLLLLPALQVMPLGWHHPWVTDDLNELQLQGSIWSTDPGATLNALYWTVIIAAVAWVTGVLWRGERSAQLVDGVLFIGASTAVLGLGLALGGVEWPDASSTWRTTGPFIYTNHAAAFWGALLPLAVLSATKSAKPWRWGIVAVLGLCVLLSGSRGGIIVSTLIMVPLVFAVAPKRRRVLIGTACLLLIAGWLSLIGIGDVTSRFDDLRGDEGATLNGRLTTWSQSLPVIADAGALGSGGGTVIPAFLRNGATEYDGIIVNHLHNDPLEWALEYGWIGAISLAAIVLFLAWWLWRGLINPAAGRRFRIGATLGVISLSLHSCGDFIWHSPAIAVLGIMLLVIALTAPPLPKQPTHTAWPLRLACIVFAGAIAALITPVWHHTAADLLARDVERQAVARAQRNLPLDGSAAIDAARTAPTNSIRLARAQAWLARREERWDDAERILESAAHLMPGDAVAWRERALVAEARGDLNTCARALTRALAWAPSYAPVQQTALLLVAQHGNALVPDDTVAHLLTAVLAQNRAQEPWFFPFAVERLGMDQVMTAIIAGRPRLQHSAEPWCRSTASLTAWLDLRKRLPMPTRWSPWRLLLARELMSDEPVCMMPVDAEGRRALAEQLHETKLPLPEALAVQLKKDGTVAEFFATPFDIRDAETHEKLSALIRRTLHQSWARVWADRLAVIARARGGDTSVIGNTADPLTIAWLAGIDPHLSPPDDIAVSEQERLLLLLARYEQWEWRTPDTGVRWSWYFHNPERDALLINDTWVGLVIDGTWHGWIRGITDLGPLLSNGLHRVVVLEP